MNENPQTPIPERDDVATLLRVAGKRQPVPADRANRVRSAVQATWETEVRRRSRVRRVVAIAAVAAAMILAAALTLRLSPFGTAPGGTLDGPIVVESLAGSVWTSPADKEATPRELSAGDRVGFGSELRTGDTGRAAIRLVSGHSVRLDVSTRLRVIDDALLALEAGTVYVESGASAVATIPVEIRTPLGVVEEIGTQFEVRLDAESVRLRLREGRVILHGDEADHEVLAGTELRLDASGTVTRREISQHGVDWDWVTGVAPMLDLEGRTAREFLDWIAREHGWGLAFADETVAHMAGETVLGGTTRRLTVDHALDAVLPTCRMSYHVADGVLLVDSIR